MNTKSNVASEPQNVEEDSISSIAHMSNSMASYGRGKDETEERGSVDESGKSKRNKKT